MSNNNNVKSVLDAATITGLREIHSGYGGKHCTKAIPRGPKNSPYFDVKTKFFNIYIQWPA